MPWSVCVSGFLDWPSTPEKARGFDPWQCAGNPSGRLLIGRWHGGGAMPEKLTGELPQRLERIRQTADGRSIEWTFLVLPVLWGVATRIDTENFDAVVSIGYGVYDSAHTIVLEKDAVNRRSRKCDAAGCTPGGTDGPPDILDESVGDVISGSANLNDRVDSIAGAIEGTGYTAVARGARAGNAFVCNETHANLLKRRRGDGRPIRVHFVHIPRPREDDYASLAGALTTVVERLVQP